MQRTLRVNDSQLASLADKARQDNSISGYMSKRSADSTKWQLRWFMLYQNFLFYYDNESAVRPSGVIFLEGCYCERLIITTAGKNKEDKQYCFAITFKKEGQRQYELRTETESDCTAWIDAIKQAGFNNLVLLKEELEQKHLHLLQIVESEKTAKWQYGQQCEELTAEIQKLRAELNTLKRERRYPALNQFISEDSEDIRKIKKVQSFFRGWLCRRRWKQIVEEYIRSPHAEGMRKRNSIVFSMVECEEEYVQQLQTLITCFLGPFKMAASSKKPPITHEDVNSIFLNSETVLFLHQIFLKGLMARMENWPTLVLGDLFDMLLPVLSIYQEYVRNHHFSLQVLAECKQNSQFSPLLKLYEEKQACEGRSLESFLTYPMHQIPRYIITLHELLAHTPHNHVERKSLEYAKNKLEELSRIMHDEVSETENIRKNLAIERQIVEGCDILLDVNQVFIRQGSLIQINHEKPKSQRGRFGSFKSEKESVHQCFLFSNHLLVTTRTQHGRLHLAKYGGKISLVDCTLIEDPSEQFLMEDDEISVSSQCSQISIQSYTLTESTASTSKEKPDYQNRDFKLLVDTKSGPPLIVHLLAPTNLDKAAWTSDISQCIDNLHFHDLLNSSMSDTSSVTMPQSVRSDPRLFRDDVDIRFSRTLNSCKLPQIRYATPERLLERLTDLRFLSIDFLNAFLLTYHAFTTGATVLEALKRVYRNPEPLIFDSSTVSGSIGSIDMFSSGSSGSRVEFSISPPESKSGFLTGSDNRRVSTDSMTCPDNRRVSTGSMTGSTFEFDKEGPRIFTGQIQKNQHWRWSFRKFEEGQRESLKEIRESAPTSPTPEHAEALAAAALEMPTDTKTVTFEQEEMTANAFLSIPKASGVSSSSSDTLSDTPSTPTILSTATSTATLEQSEFSPKSSPVKKVAPITLSPPLMPDFDDDGMLKPEVDTPRPRPPSPITPSHSAPSMFTYLKSRTNKRGSADTGDLSSSPRSSFQYPDGSPKHHGKAGVVVTSSRASTRRSSSSCAAAAFAAATAGSGNPREIPRDLPRGINRYHSAGAGDMKIPLVKKRDSSVISTAATMRVLNVLRHWVSKHPLDFDCNPELKEMAVDFLEEMVCNTNLLPAEHKAAAQMLRTLTKEDPSNVKIDLNLLLAPALTPAKETIESLSALEIAEQMTYMDHKIFINIRSEEFLGQAWMKPEKATKAPHIWLITKHFNEMSKLVVSEIICRPNIQDRAMVIEKWAAVADICRCLHNFNGVLQICAAFVNSSVYRLKKTWEKLSKTTKQTIDKLQNLVSSDGRFRNMREALHRSDPPCIPYLGMYLTDLSFIEEGTPNFTEDGLVNFSKMRMIAHVIREIRVFQQTPYKIEHNPKVTNYLQDASLLLSDDELYTKSLHIEPRQSRLSIISTNPKE